MKYRNEQDRTHTDNPGSKLCVCSLYREVTSPPPCLSYIGVGLPEFVTVEGSVEGRSLRGTIKIRRPKLLLSLATITPLCFSILVFPGNYHKWGNLSNFDFHSKKYWNPQWCVLHSSCAAMHASVGFPCLQQCLKASNQGHKYCTVHP